MHRGAAAWPNSRAAISPASARLEARQIGPLTRAMLAGDSMHEGALFFSEHCLAADLLAESAAKLRLCLVDAVVLTLPGLIALRVDDLGERQAPGGRPRRRCAKVG